MKRNDEIAIAACAYGSRGSSIDFTAGAKWSDNHPKCPWISVEERLPEAEEEVLLYNSHSVQHYETGWLRKKKGDNNSKWVVSNGFVEDDDITHWMPIPNLPKE